MAEESKPVELEDDTLEFVSGGIVHKFDQVKGTIDDYLCCEKCGMRFESGDRVGAILHEANCTGTPQK